METRFHRWQFAVVFCAPQLLPFSVLARSRRYLA